MWFMRREREERREEKREDKVDVGTKSGGRCWKPPLPWNDALRRPPCGGASCWCKLITDLGHRVKRQRQTNHLVGLQRCGLFIYSSNTAIVCTLLFVVFHWLCCSFNKYACMCALSFMSRRDGGCTLPLLLYFISALLLSHTQSHTHTHAHF